MVWLRLPVFNEQMVQNVMDLVANLNLSMITDEFGWGTMHVNDILKGVDKLLLSFHAKDISDKRFCANKDLGNLRSIVNGWGVEKNSVSGNWFCTVLNIAGRTG